MSQIFAVEHDVPLRGVIGRRPWIKRGKIVAFGEDPSLGFKNLFETEEITGYISDCAVIEIPVVEQVSKRSTGKKSRNIKTRTVMQKKLIVAVQLQPSMWRENQESSLLMFDLPQ